MKYLRLFEEFTSECDELEIRQSTIPQAGKGLFTLVDIDKDSKISEFTGEIISEEDSLKLEGPRGHYLIDAGDGKMLDVYNSDCLAKSANDARDHRNNSEIVEEHGRFWLVSTRDIYAGEEIFCSYGDGYWENWQ